MKFGNIFLYFLLGIIKVFGLKCMNGTKVKDCVKDRGDTGHCQVLSVKSISDPT